MMRNRPFFAILLTTGLWLTGAATAQQQQAIPDAPQAQKKPAPKPITQAAPPADDATPAPDSAAGKPPAGKDDNAFPEAVSKEAADKAGKEESQPDIKDAGKKPAAEANPFPEDISRDAAKASGNEAAPDRGSTSVPSGVSSSQSSSLSDQEDKLQVTDPARAKKDTEVGSFYLKTKDYEGALLRFKDASKADPTNVDAIFGLAEAQRILGKKADAERNYQLYLDIVPNGSKAKESMKALKTLEAQK